MSDPSVLLMHRSPPENAGGTDAIERAVREKLPELDLRRAADYDETLSAIAEAEIVIEHRIDDPHLAAAENVAWIQSLSAGYDRFDLDRLDDRGITLTTAAGVHAEPIAQHVLGYILNFERGFFRARRQQARNEWRRFTPTELTGKTVTIVGVGAIGGRIADRLDPFDVRIVGVKRDLESVTDAVDNVLPPSELHTAVGGADYVVVACPLTPETRGMFDHHVFDSMSTESVFINIARGAVAEQSALIEALQTGNLAGAALDVATDEPLSPESPLWDLENVFITPHMAGGSQHYAERVAAIFGRNYERYTKGNVEEMENRVI